MVNANGRKWRNQVDTKWAEMVDADGHQWPQSKLKKGFQRLYKWSPEWCFQMVTRAVCPCEHLEPEFCQAKMAMDPESTLFFEMVTQVVPPKGNS